MENLDKKWESMQETFRASKQASKKDVPLNGEELELAHKECEKGQNEPVDPWFKAQHVKNVADPVADRLCQDAGRE